MNVLQTLDWTEDTENGRTEDVPAATIHWQEFIEYDSNVTHANYLLAIYEIISDVSFVRNWIFILRIFLFLRIYRIEHFYFV